MDMVNESIKPLIKKFKTRQHFYIYDVNSNLLLSANALAYEMIDYLYLLNEEQMVEHFKTRFQPKRIRHQYHMLQWLKEKKHCFSCHHPKISSQVEFEKDLKDFYHGHLNQLILELSQDCNLRCRYCIFSGSHPWERSHNPAKMSWETARLALDFFIEHTKNNIQGKIKPAITFYGGEPLLNFDVMAKTVQYIKDKRLFHLYQFSFTTNGTLLNDKIIQFLENNSISILVSLDGPREINDRYRVYHDGRGTFDMVLSNLQKIKEQSPEYFSRHISFNVGITPPYNFPGVIRLFYRHKFFEPFRDKIRVFFTIIEDSEFEKDFHLEDQKEKLSEVLQKLERRYTRALRVDKYDNLTIEKNLFLMDFHEIACRSIEPLKSSCPPKGSCVPGKRRLFIDTKGIFYMCERVGANYPIGDVKNGFNYPLILDFYRQYDAFFSGCSNCWALRLCKKCFQDIRKGATLDTERRDAFCKTKREYLERHLINYCYIREKKPDAFKFMEKVVIL